jgi:hypothetical protein
VLEAKGLHGCELTMERGAREGRLGMYPSLMDRNGEGLGGRIGMQELGGKS